MSEGIDAVLKVSELVQGTCHGNISLPLSQDRVGLDKGQDELIAGHCRKA